MPPPPPPPPAIVVTYCAPDDAIGREWVLVPAGEDGADGRCLRLTAAAREGDQSPDPFDPEAAPVLTTAQPPPAPASLNPPRGVEWMLGTGYGWSFDLLQSAGGRRYVAATVSWGRDLTRDVGPGPLRGRLMWAVEAMPVYGQHAPAATVGIGLSPLVWRWRFTPGPRAAPFAELAFGGLVTGQPVPEGTERANFLTHGALGIRWRPSARWSLVTAYRFQHISNGNQLQSNPGVNAHVVWIGLAR